MLRKAELVAILVAVLEWYEDELSYRDVDMAELLERLIETVDEY